MKNHFYHSDRLLKVVTLFVTFLKIGAFTFGGGYAMIPLIEREIVQKKKWISDEDILNIIAISESTPGPIAINSATFVGYKIAGFWGAICSTLGVVIPSFFVILIISVILRRFEDIQVIKYAFNGIRAGVLALIIKALISMYRQCPKNILSYIIIAASFLTVAFFKVNVLLVIVCCGIAGISASVIADRRITK